MSPCQVELDLYAYLSLKFQKCVSGHMPAHAGTIALLDLDVGKTPILPVTLNCNLSKPNVVVGYIRQEASVRLATPVPYTPSQGKARPIWQIIKIMRLHYRKYQRSFP